MEGKSNKKSMKRNYSNSPFNNFKEINKLNIHNKLKSVQDSFLSDTSIAFEESENTNLLEEFRIKIRKKNYLIREYINKINELLLKEEENKYKYKMIEKLNKNLKQKIDILQQEIIKKDLILQKNGINEDEISNQDYSMLESINSRNFFHSEKEYYENKISILIQKNKELNTEVLKNRKIIIDLNNRNNHLLEKNEKLEKKYHFLEINSLMTLSPFQNHNNININNYKIRNNNNNNLNLNLEQQKNKTGNNFYQPKLKKNFPKNSIEDTLSSDINTNVYKSMSIKRNTSNNKIRINKDIQTLNEKYINKVKEYKILYDNFIKLKGKYLSDNKKYINNTNILKSKNIQLNKIIIENKNEIKNLKLLLSNIDKNNNTNINQHKFENSSDEESVKNNQIDDLKKELNIKIETINQQKNKIEELTKQNKELALKKKEDIKNFSLISDEDDEIDKKNNKENITYEKIYNDLILKTDLLKQKENELSLLLEKSKKLEDNIKELNKLIDEKNKNIEELNKKFKEEMLNLENKIQKNNEEKIKSDKIIEENENNIFLFKQKISDLEKSIIEKDVSINNLNKKIFELNQNIEKINLENQKNKTFYNNIEENNKKLELEFNDYKNINLEKISKLEKELLAKNEEIRSKTLELKIKEETIGKINENYNHNKNDYTDMINKFNEEILQLNQKINKLTDELNLKKSEIKKILEEKTKINEENGRFKILSEDLKSKQLELLLSNEEISKKLKNLEIENEKLNKNIEEENEEKNEQINELVSKINDYELQIKNIKFDYDEKKLELKKLENNVKEKDNTIKQISKNIDEIQNNNEELVEENKNLKNENKKMKDKIILFEEEKIKLINNLNDKENEYNLNKKKVSDLNQQMEDFKSMFNQKMEEIQNLKINKSKLETELNIANLELKQKGENIKQLEEKYQIIKNETLNNGNSTTANYNDSNMNNDLMNFMEQNTQLNKEKNNLEKELNILKDNNILFTEELNNFKRENDTLQKKLNKLSEENMNITDNYNQINNKYYELKKILNEKDKEIKESKEIYTALIEKQKNKVEEELNISPLSHKIITSKKYQKLIWYLIYKKNESKNNEINKDENNYNNYKWVTGLILSKDNLSKFNKFETDEQTIKDLQDYIFNLQKKLERKEESLSIMDYKNKKLIEQNHNKTANLKGILKNNLIADISKNTIGEQNKVNFSAVNEISQLQTEISKLKEEIKAKEKLESGMPKNINYILQDENSDFLDDEIKDNKNGGMLDFIKNENIDETNSRRSGVPGGVSVKSQISSNNDYKASEKKVDDYLNKCIIEENDLDIIKQNEEQMKLLKDEIKEKNNKLKMLSEQIEELMKNIKCDMKNKPQIVQICQILGKSPEEVNKIVNKKKTIF